MRLFLFTTCFLFLALPVTRAQGQGADTIIAKGKLTINNVQFDYIKLRRPSGTDGEDVFELYAHNKKLLSHTLRDREADCNSESLEFGDVEPSDSSLTFYSYWAWVGGCCGMPYGARKQVYTVNKLGQLHLSSSAIFLEKYKTTLYGMTGKEATQFMAGIEKEYHATFVTDSQATDLLNEVKQRFAKQILKETKGWENNRYGYRR